jgi:hypothetical protein
MLSVQSGGTKVMPKNCFTPAAQQAGREAGIARANQIDLGPIIAELRAAGITSKKGIAGAQQPRHPAVARVLARLAG